MDPLQNSEGPKDSGAHLLKIVTDILDLAKIEAEKVTIEKDAFNLGEMPEKSPGMIKEYAFERSLQIKSDIQPDLGWLYGDETRLTLAAYNLLSNAGYKQKKPPYKNHKLTRFRETTNCFTYLKKKTMHCHS